MGRERPPSWTWRKNAYLRVGSINVNGLSVLKRRELVNSIKEGRLDVIEVQETHIKDCGMIDMGCGWSK